ncbi:MAG: cohesin domain-containing protein [Candidatus Aenigmarchaeota archaeon]|nr:cohesin domain-containing protein [Candidatus Aenigmarchaeota archaeon]
MKSKNFPLVFCAVFSAVCFLCSASHASALVSISPASANYSIYSRSQFTVNVSISGVNNVYGFQFNLNYNSTVLEFMSMSEGTFLNNNNHNATFCLAPNTTTSGVINNFACSRLGTGSVNGNGVLANITFRLKSIASFPGKGYMNLSNVKISDINSQPLDNSFRNGSAMIYACLPPDSKACVLNGCSGTQTCGSDKKWGGCIAGGVQAEVCDNIDNDCDGSVDEGLSRLCSQNHQGICATGSETCAGGAWGGCPSPQTEICDNSVDESCDGADPLCSGDADGNRCVDVIDLALVGANFGLKSGFDVRADINKNGEVDIFDLVAIGRDFGFGSAC